MSRSSVGLMDPLVFARPRADFVTRGNYLSAVASRVDSFWVPDHVNSLFPRVLWTPKYAGPSRLVPSPDAVLEPWTMLGSIAARNRLARLRLGIGVTDAGRRNPAVTAQAAVTLDHLTRGRTILGIGPGEREGNEPYGVEWSKPVARFEEAMATIRALWSSKGELVNRDSPFFPLRNALFDLPPYKGRWPDVWVAAHGPRMLRAAGRYGDGWFPAFPQRPEDYAQRLEIIRAAASDAGRDPMSITPALWMLVVTGRSSDDVDEALDADIMKTWALNASDEVWGRHGQTHPLGAGFSGAQDHLPQTLDEETVLSHIARVPQSLLREIFLTGTVDEVLQQAAQWRRCGVRYLVVVNQTIAQPSLRNGIASQLSFTNVVSGLKRLFPAMS
ncbi:LLM class flavin-dependent oxidoreductase [Mycobacterium deserti]|uniref:LLM class flavin-dependent oxidoreductase n=1 Tax=Mycobacterium deserti TaxID=2978347 RepID=A0ABT2M838_9MYCO|nr:LLM class flavin-dependent oxidoreductase [Mycobacterium deserti]MCT7658430.1 LLM class flavin-dependent oxidoreductase [Mycobacterium deserti]